jgi:hypothetical protein
VLFTSYYSSGFSCGINNCINIYMLNCVYIDYLSIDTILFKSITCYNSFIYHNSCSKNCYIFTWPQYNSFANFVFILIFIV